MVANNNGSLKAFLVLQIVLLLVFQCSAITITDAEYLKMPKLFHLDNFDDCLTNDGLFCVTKIELQPVSYNNLSEAWKTIEWVKTDPFYYRHDWLRHGICLQDSCPRIPRANYTMGFDNKDLMNDISLCYSQKYAHIGLKATTLELFCEGKDPYYKVDIYDKIFAGYIITLFALLVIGSFYEGLARYKSQEEYDRIVRTPIGKFLACFSIVKNWKKLRKDNESEDGNQLAHIQGIRTFNVMIVIIVHIVMLPATTYIQNSKFMEEVSKRGENTLFSNGNHAVMTFMMISAFLFSYNFLLIFDGGRKFSLKHIVLAMVNRCIRLYPCLLTAIAFSATWMIHFERGPHLHNIMLIERNNCRDNWWTNALFINTFVNKENMCMQQTWYLASDSQLFFVSLFIMGAVVKYKKHALRILLTILVFSIFIPFCIFYYYDVVEMVIPCGECLQHTFAKTPDWHFLTAQPLSILGSYVVGLIYGYLFHDYLRKKQYDFVNKIWVQVIWWILALVGSLGSIFIGAFFIQEGYVHSRLLAAVNVTIAKTFFAAIMGMIILGVNQNIGWFVKDVLKWKPIQYIGRLSYSTYLLHTIVIRMRFVIDRSPLYTSNYIWLSESIGIMGVTFIYAAIFCLLVEMPFSNMQKEYLSPAPKMSSPEKKPDKAKKEK